MNKKFKCIIYLVLILFISFVSFFTYKTVKKSKVIYVTEERYKKDIEETIEEEVFPFFDTNSEKNKKYVYKNYMNLNYNFNANENVEFNMVLPRYLNHKMNVSKDDPFKFVNSRYVTLGKLEDNERQISGAIYSFNTDLEVSSASINTHFVVKTLNLTPVKVNYNYYVDDVKSDILAINNENGEFTRSTVVRSSSLYYVLTFTFKNFYHYMQHAKEVSIIFASFSPKKFSNKLTNVDLDLLKVNNYSLLYPRGWKTKNEYVEKDKLTRISITALNGSAMFDIDLYEDNNKPLQKLIDEYLEVIKKHGYIFDGIDIKTMVYSRENNRVLFALKNSKTKNDIPLTIYIKIEQNGDKKIVAIMYTSRTEERSYLRYKEYERLFEIVSMTSSLSVIYDKNIQDTDWIKLYNNK